MQDQHPALLPFAIYMADNTLILGHRLSEWCGYGPVLEQDIAMTNLSLDLIGHARMYFQWAAILEGKGRTEDDIAYLRTEREYTCALLTEQPNGDFAHTIIRQFLFDTWHLPLLEAMVDSPVSELSAIAEKAVKEVRYHYKWSSDWVLRLADGTDESRSRTLTALDDLWMYREELFLPAVFEMQLIQAGFIPDPENHRAKSNVLIKNIFDACALDIPANSPVQKGGKTGIHTEHLGHLLAELQFMQRAYPGLQW